MGYTTLFEGFDALLEELKLVGEKQLRVWIVKFEAETFWLFVPIDKSSFPLGILRRLSPEKVKKERISYVTLKEHSKLKKAKPKRAYGLMSQKHRLQRSKGGFRLSMPYTKRLTPKENFRAEKNHHKGQLTK